MKQITKQYELKKVPTNLNKKFKKVGKIDYLKLFLYKGSGSGQESSGSTTLLITQHKNLTSRYRYRVPVLYRYFLCVA